MDARTLGEWAGTILSDCLHLRIIALATRRQKSKTEPAMTIAALSDREMQLSTQVAELKREVAELREALARTSQARLKKAPSRRGLKAKGVTSPTGPSINT
jgi:septal ring factor EnvC (AmiA/AmiB activator)